MEHSLKKVVIRKITKNNIIKKKATFINGLMEGEYYYDGKDYRMECNYIEGYKYGKINIKVIQEGVNVETLLSQNIEEHTLYKYLISIKESDYCMYEVLRYRDILHVNKFILSLNLY